MFTRSIVRHHHPPFFCLVLFICFTGVQAGCSYPNADDSCEQLLACCESLTPALQPQCQALYIQYQFEYDQWQEHIDAETRCQDALFMMGSLCEGGDDVSATPFSVESNAAERAVCQDYLECVIAVTPEALLVAAQTYGPDGICWEALDSARCEKACMELMAKLAIDSDGHPECRQFYEKH